MEFLKALQGAITLGVTAKEFLHIWNLEMNANLHEENRWETLSQVNSGCGLDSSAEHAGLYLKLRSELQKFVQVEIQEKVTKMSDRLEQQIVTKMSDRLEQQIVTKMSDRLEQHFVTRISDRFELQWVNKMSHLLEQHWRQQLEQLKSELNSCLEVVCSHITNTADEHTDSLKSLLLQELTFPELELKTISLKKNATPVHKTTFKNFKQGSCNKIVESLTHGETEALSEIRENKCDLKDRVRSNDSYVPIHIRELQTGPLSESGNYINYNIDSCKPTKSSPMSAYSVKKAPIQSCEPIAVQSEMQREIALKQSELPSSKDKGSSPEETEDGSEFPVQAYVAADQVSEKIENCNYDDLTTENTNKQKISKHTSKIFASFTVLNLETFVASRETLITSFYYPGSKTCNVRLSICFDDDSSLRICLLVSKGPVDYPERRPIFLTCDGFIYNNSGNYSKIWTLGPVQCQRPIKDKEVELKAYMCLKTMKGKYPNVTFKTLQEKCYIRNNCLKFEWELSILPPV